MFEQFDRKFVEWIVWCLTSINISWKLLRGWSINLYRWSKIPISCDPKGITKLFLEHYLMVKVENEKCLTLD